MCCDSLIRSSDRCMWSLDKGLVWVAVVWRHHRYQGDRFVGISSSWTTVIYWIRGRGWPGQDVRDYTWHPPLPWQNTRSNTSRSRSHKTRMDNIFDHINSDLCGLKAIEYAKIKLSLFTMVCCVYPCILSGYWESGIEMKGQCRGHIVVWPDIDKGRGKSYTDHNL